MMDWRFTLSSFEPSSNTTASLSRHERRCFILSNVNFRCEQLLCDEQGTMQLLTQSELDALPAIEIDSEQQLGELNGAPLWVVVITGEPEINGSQWLGLRSQLGKVAEAGFNLAARALQMAQWHYDHRFCGRCGNATSKDNEDAAKICSSCNLRFYPRISPCMIVLVTRGDELLLARHARATRVVYTTLAGFVEAGERLEDAVHREVMEEVGVTIERLTYFKSQPWPFPNQLMLGFFAEYVSGDLKIDGEEILDANWFRYDQLPEVSSAASVAGQLIFDFVARRKALNLGA
jgi:NAD+ diphosphatase